MQISALMKIGSSCLGTVPISTTSRIFVGSFSGAAEFALPYWDWTRNPQIPAAFWGEDNPLDRPRFANPQSTVSDEFIGTDVITRIMRKPDFEGFGSGRSSLPRGGNGGGFGTLEGTPHNRIHTFVGGDMRTALSPLDPIFWLHHCNIDRIWASWNAITGNTNPSDSSIRRLRVRCQFRQANRLCSRCKNF